MLGGRKLFAFFFFAFFFSTPICAEEALQIGTILKSPEAYHLRLVILEGMVREMQALKPYSSWGRECYAATFYLADKTGTIEVLVPGVCGNPTLYPPPVSGLSDGEKVTIEARIEAPGYYTGQGLSPGGEARRNALAIATKISRN